MSLFDPDDPELDLDALDDDELLLLLDDPDPEPDDAPRRRPITDVDIPIDAYPPAHTEGTDQP